MYCSCLENSYETPLLLKSRKLTLHSQALRNAYGEIRGIKATKLRGEQALFECSECEKHFDLLVEKMRMTLNNGLR
jgi:hypothetical protein